MSTRRTFLMQAVTSVIATAGIKVAQTSPDVTRVPMNTYKIPHTDLVVSRIAYGCANLGGSWDKEAVSADAFTEATRAINAAYESGITLFDHADIYALGKSETAFGRILKQQSPGLRNRIVIQSKCGVVISSSPLEPQRGDPHRFDLSYDHIIRSVEESLQRLGTDRLDLLLLHRPDPLQEPEEVAKAFDKLQSSGKVRHFGVSNHTATQIALLKKFVRQPLVVNQLELGLTHPELITDGIDTNRQEGRRLSQGYTGVAGILDYCRLNDIQVQAYSPVRGFLNPKAASPAIKQTMQLLTDMAEEKSTTPLAVALAWLLRHPAGIVPIIGTSNPKHIVENCEADRVAISRQEWYALLIAATGLAPASLL